MRTNLRGAPAAAPGGVRHRVGRRAQGLAQGHAAVVGPAGGRLVRRLRAATCGAGRAATARRAAHSLWTDTAGERGGRVVHRAGSRGGNCRTKLNVDAGGSVDARGVAGPTGNHTRRPDEVGCRAAVSRHRATRAGSHLDPNANRGTADDPGADTHGSRCSRACREHACRRACSQARRRACQSGCSARDCDRGHVRTHARRADGGCGSPSTDSTIADRHRSTHPATPLDRRCRSERRGHGGGGRHRRAVDALGDDVRRPVRRPVGRPFVRRRR